MNKKLLKSVMVKNGDTYQSLSKYLGITESALSNKINNKVSIGFTQPEIYKIKAKYNLTSNELESIFFSQEVS